MASPTLPLTISSMESNQGGMRLKFLVCFVPLTPPPPPPSLYYESYCDVADEAGLLQLLQSRVFIFT